jgi:hypothetical protein
MNVALNRNANDDHKQLAEAEADRDAAEAKASALFDSLAETERERDALRAFVRDLFDTLDWPDTGTLDGFDFQDLCERHGLLVPREATGPCNVGCEDGVNCSCAEYGDGEWPQTCYRKAEWLTDRAAE